MAYALALCFNSTLNESLERLAQRAELRGHEALCLQIKRLQLNEKDNHDRKQVINYQGVAKS